MGLFDLFGSREKRSEAALRESDEVFRQIAEHISETTRSAGTELDPGLLGVVAQQVQEVAASHAHLKLLARSASGRFSSSLRRLTSALVEKAST